MTRCSIVWRSELCQSVSNVKKQSRFRFLHSLGHFTIFILLNVHFLSLFTDDFRSCSRSLLSRWHVVYNRKVFVCILIFSIKWREEKRRRIANRTQQHWETHFFFNDCEKKCFFVRLRNLKERSNAQLGFSRETCRKFLHCKATETRW